MADGSKPDGISAGFAAPQDNPFSDLIPTDGIARPATAAQALARGIDQYQGMAYGAAEALGEATGIEALKAFGKEGRERNVLEAAESAPPAQEFTGINNPSTALQWAKETVVGQAPNIAQSVAGGTAGAYIGAFGGPLAPVTVPLGAAIGAFLPSLVSGIGEVQGNIKERDPNAVAPGYALAGGVAIGALDSILPGKIGSQLVKRFGVDVAEQIAKKALAKQVPESVVREGGKAAAIEGLTEAVQEAIGDVTAAAATAQGLSPDLGKKMLEAAAAGALVGGTMSAGERAVRRAREVGEPETPPPSSPPPEPITSSPAATTPPPVMSETPEPAPSIKLYRGEPDPETFDPRFADPRRVGRWYTTDIEDARGYAGPGGNVFELEVPADAKISRGRGKAADDRHFTVPKALQKQRKLIETVPAETAAVETTVAPESDERIPVDEGNPFSDLVPEKPAVSPRARAVNNMRAELEEAEPGSPLAAALDQAVSTTITPDGVRAIRWARENGRMDIANHILLKAEELMQGAERNARETPELKEWADRQRATFDTMRLVAEGRAVAMDDADVPPAPKIRMPQDVLAYIRGLGGIKDETGELRQMDAHKTTGIINNKSGMIPDRVRALMVEQGFLTDSPYEEETTSTVNDLYDLVDRALRGERIYRDVDREVAEQARAERWASTQDDEDTYRIVSAIRQIYDENDLPYPFTAAEEDDLVRLVKAGLSVEEAIEREAIDWVNEVEDNEADSTRASGEREAVEGGRGTGERSEPGSAARGAGADVRVAGEAREDEILAAAGGSSSFADWVRATSAQVDRTATAIRSGLESGQLRLEKRLNDRTVRLATLSPDGAGAFRVTTFIDGEPASHIDYKATERDIRQAATEMAPRVEDGAGTAQRAPTPDRSFWSSIKPLDAQLTGEAGRAIDDWVGGPHDTIARGLTSGLMVPGRLEGMSDATLDRMAQPVRAALRARYGDTITVYRGEAARGGQSTGRQNRLVSYTTSRKVAEAFAGAREDARKLYTEQEIAAAEQALRANGEVKVGRTTYRQEPGSEYVDMYDDAGGFITDVPSVRRDLEASNEARREFNDEREEALRGVRKVQIPVDAVVWATDRFNQQEIIAKAGYEASADDGLLAAIGGRSEDGTGSAFEEASEESWNDAAARGTANEWANERAETRSVRQGPAERSEVERAAANVMSGIQKLEKGLRAKKASPEQIAAAIEEQYGLKVKPDEIAKGNVWWRIEDILADETGRGIRRTPERVMRLAELLLQPEKLSNQQLAGMLSQEFRLPVTDTWIRNTIAMHGLRQDARAKRNASIEQRWTPERRALFNRLSERGALISDMVRQLDALPGPRVTAGAVEQYRQITAPKRSWTTQKKTRGGLLNEADLARLQSGEFEGKTAHEIALILGRPDPARGIPARPVTRMMIVGHWKRQRDAKLRDELRAQSALKKPSDEPMFAAGWWKPDQWLDAWRDRKDGRDSTDGSERQPDGGQARGESGSAAAGRSGAQPLDPASGGVGADGGRDGSARIFALRGYVGRSIDSIPTAAGLGQRFVFLHPEKAKVLVGERGPRATVARLRAVPNWVARAHVIERQPGVWTVADIKVRSNKRMRGIGNELLTQIEQDLGTDLAPPHTMTPDLFRLWQKRDPDSVADYARWRMMLHSRDRLERMRAVSQSLIEDADTDTRTRNAALKDVAEIDRVLEDLAGTDDIDAAFGTPSEAEARRKTAYSMVRMNRTFTVPQEVVDAMHAALEPHLGMVPPDVNVATLARIEPAPGKPGEPHGRFVFKMADGTEGFLTGRLDQLLGYRAGFVPARDGDRAAIVFFNLTLPDEVGNGLRGTLAHEVTHALRRKGIIERGAWGRLLAHAKSLRVLDYEQRGFLQSIGNSTYRSVPTGRKLRDVYGMDYAGRSDYNEIMDQEEVTHLLELYVHNQLPKMDVDPVRDILDDILSGRKWGRAQEVAADPVPAGAIRTADGTMVDPPKSEREYVSGATYWNAIHDQYWDGDERKASSRATPYQGDLPPVGSWRIDRLRGIHGREVARLVDIPIARLQLPELNERGELDPMKRGDDERYASWLEAGLRAPPIEVLQTEQGNLRVTDGHRRVLAAKRAGRSYVEGWVHYTVPDPRGRVDSNGRPLQVGLTYEMVNPDWDKPAPSTRRGRQSAQMEMDLALEGDLPVTPGLDMSLEVRKARAEEQGFDTSRVWYHGTKNDVAAFNLKRAGASDPGLVGRAIYATPSSEQAGQFATSPHYGKGAAPNVIPLYVRLRNPAVVIDGVLPDGRRLTEAHPNGITKDSASQLSRVLKAVGHDGVIFQDSEGDVTQIAVFDPRDTRSVNAAFDPANAGSTDLLAAADRGKTRLAALHNLSAENLLFADKMGGIAVPSIAVVKEGMGVEGFGDITLIGRRDLGDPARNPVFDADAWTTRFPKPDYKAASSKKAQAFVDRMRPYAAKFDDTSSMHEAWDYLVNTPDPEKNVSQLLRSEAAQAMFLESKGQRVEPVMRPATASMRNPWVAMPAFQAYAAERGGTIGHDMRPGDPEWQGLSDAVRRAVGEFVAREGNARMTDEDRADLRQIYEDELFDENGSLFFGKTQWLDSDLKKVGQTEVDATRTRERLEAALAPYAAEFKGWIEKQIVPMYGEPRLKLRGKWAPYTLDNIVEAMTAKRGVKVQEDSMFFSPGKARADASKQFKRLEPMREDADEQIEPAAEVNAARERANTLMEEYRGNVVPFNKWVMAARDSRSSMSPTFDALDGSMRALAAWAQGGKLTWEALGRALAREDFVNVPRDVLEQGVEAGKAFLQAPVPYFEAKPQRAVKLNEFAGAVIPSDADASVRAALDRNGIPYREYQKDGREAQAAAAAAFAQDLAREGQDTLFAIQGPPAAANDDPAPLRLSETQIESIITRVIRRLRG